MGSVAEPQTNVLLVEDEELIADMVGDVLSERGFSVHIVPDAEGALRHLQTGARVDVLFTDINLAGEMDGSQLAEKARELRPDLPIVYASGRYSASSISPLVSRSMFLPKPYDPFDVSTLLSRMVAQAA